MVWGSTGSLHWMSTEPRGSTCIGHSPDLKTISRQPSLPSPLFLGGWIYVPLLAEEALYQPDCPSAQVSCLIWYRVWPCAPGWPWTHYVDQDGLNPRLSSCLFLLSAGIIGIYNHIQLYCFHQTHYFWVLGQFLSLWLLFRYSIHYFLWVLKKSLRNIPSTSVVWTLHEIHLLSYRKQRQIRMEWKAFSPTPPIRKRMPAHANFPLHFHLFNYFLLCWISGDLHEVVWPSYISLAHPNGQPSPDILFRRLNSWSAACLQYFCDS